MSIDRLDARLITLVSEQSGISVVECARRLGVARATAQGRLDRLRRSGVIASEAPSIDPAALGYPLRTFCTIQIRQSIGHQRVAEGLTLIPELLELHTITGDADMMATIVTRSTNDLQRVLDLMSNTEGVARVSTRLALESHFRNRTLPLVQSAVAGEADPAPQQRA
ncbi:Lrp/AsnC family transcriptional regulator [Leucobacter triazinivorans]|uniref:Lrp/AsnC family transcriptional regulator n=1 Tax=Leucobacter triazinivorans TaxID=1784719 RepID=A0A4P6KEF1_9MICO|nr:Lrp/AsnC family transcriptional regulator [Leucobacter triazinivorans]QBE48815.1 Lrp/AsnC family transcriptional regulator [Leucobacter triazinivorans]